MKDDEKRMDWAAREDERDRRAAKEKAKTDERSERDVRRKVESGTELFKQLHAWMEKQAKSYGGDNLKKAFEVGAIGTSGGPGTHDFFMVSRTNRERLPMKISYHSPPEPYEVIVECGVLPSPRYPLSVGDNGDLFFVTPKGQSATIEELGEESLDSWMRAPM